MRRLRRFLFGALMAALFLLGSRALIKGPAPETAGTPPAPRGPVVCAMTEPADLQSACRAQSVSPHAEAAVAVAHTEPVIPLPEADGNGLVLTGRSWFRAAYAACPPEAAFG